MDSSVEDRQAGTRVAEILGVRSNPRHHKRSALLGSPGGCRAPSPLWGRSGGRTLLGAARPDFRPTAFERSLGNARAQRLRRGASTDTPAADEVPARSKSPLGRRADEVQQQLIRYVTHDPQFGRPCRRRPSHIVADTLERDGIAGDPARPGRGGGASSGVAEG